MPLFEFECVKCEVRVEKLQNFKDTSPLCPECGAMMTRHLGTIAHVRIKGLGYNARRKWMTGSAPYTTRATKEWTPDNPVPFK